MVALRAPVIHVLHVVVAGDIGGAERLLVDLHAHSTQCIHSVLLLTSNPKLREYFATRGLRILDGGHAPENPLAFLQRSYGSATLAWAECVARRERVHVVHAHTLGSHVLAARLGRQIARPVVRTEHHFSHYRDRSASWFTRSALRNTASLVAISDFIARFVHAEVPAHAHKLTTIRNGIDTKRFAYCDFPAPATQARLRIAIACRLESWKGVDLALHALRDLPEVELAVAGIGSQHKILVALTQRLGISERVRFVGRVEDVAAFYAEAHLGLNTSQQEPLGLSVLEAMAVGRPVVAFAEGGIPEIVSDGVTGFLARERNVPALTKAIRRAHATPRAELQAMGETAREFVGTQASAPRMAAQYEALYAKHTQQGGALP
jgi:glycosyltransferase involved in cell wall biosynthesis